MTYLVVVPVINHTISTNCLASMTRGVRLNTLVVDNSPEKFSYKDVDIFRPEQNIGVGRSWNVGARQVLGQGLDYLVICSATMVFEKGGLDLVAALKKNQDPHGMETNHSWHLICIGRPTLEKIGLFDENFYPAYYEDSDYIRRMELAGIHIPMTTDKRLPRVEIQASEQGTAHGLKSGVKVNMAACRDYFIKKWGTDPLYDSQESRDKMYSDPFNDRRRSLKYWRSHSIGYLKNKYGL